MAPSDSKDPFLRIPWTAALLKRPNLIQQVPYSRVPKSSTEDSLYAETFKTRRTLRSLLAFYPRPSSDAARVDSITTLITLGDGMNGHPGILHGGVVGVIIDESMGILMSINHQRDHLRKVAAGHAEGELPEEGYQAYTADLRVRFKKPVMTPGAVAVRSRYVKVEGRKEWIESVITQREGATEDDDGEEVVCAVGEALWIRPRNRPGESRL